MRYLILLAALTVLFLVVVPASAVDLGTLAPDEISTLLAIGTNGNDASGFCGSWQLAVPEINQVPIPIFLDLYLPLDLTEVRGAGLSAGLSGIGGNDALRLTGGVGYLDGWTAIIGVRFVSKISF